MSLWPALKCAHISIAPSAATSLGTGNTRSFPPPSERRLGFTWRMTGDRDFRAVMFVALQVAVNVAREQTVRLALGVVEENTGEVPASLHVEPVQVALLGFEHGVKVAREDDARLDRVIVGA